MCTSRPRQRGLSLVELLMFIVIISVAVVGLLRVVGMTTAASADPLRRKQALLIAEALLEEVELARFTYCDPSDVNAASATSTADCASAVEDVGQQAPEPAGTRPYDNVNDYVSQFNQAEAAFNNGSNVLSDVNLNALGAAGYTATLNIAPAALGGIASAAAPAAMEVLRITVNVSYGSDSVVLDGYRTRYAPGAQ